MLMLDKKRATTSGASGRALDATALAREWEGNPRWRGIPIVVFQDVETRDSRCINGLHVQTFVRSRFHKGGTLITFANGDTVTVEGDFDTVFDTLTGRVDG